MRDHSAMPTSHNDAFAANAERLRLSDLWVSLFDLWFLLPLVGLMVLSERGGTAETLGRDLVVMGASWGLSAVLFRTSLPLQPLKVWAFMFVALRPDPLVVSVSAILLGLLLFLSGISGFSRSLESRLGDLAFERVRRALSSYVRAVALISLGIVALRHLPHPPHLTISVPGGEGMSSAAIFPVLLLVLAQYPVTLLNGILATVRVCRESGRSPGVARVPLTGSSLSLWLGIADCVVGALGALPFCHGSGNLWFYRRHGVRSADPSIMSASLLVALGMLLLLNMVPLPGPLLCSVFLAGFLIAEFLMKKERPLPERRPSGSPGLFECWAIGGGVVSGAIILGGIPCLLALLLGMNAAAAFSRLDEGGGELVRGESRVVEVSCGCYLSPCAPGTEALSPAGEVPGGLIEAPCWCAPSSSLPGPFSQDERALLSHRLRRLFRRAREIPEQPLHAHYFILLFLLCLVLGVLRSFQKVSHRIASSFPQEIFPLPPARSP